MKNQPEKQRKKIYWVVCLIAALAITAARVICHFAGAALSDTATRVFGGAETVAVAGMVFFYLRWRQDNGTNKR